MAKDVKCTKPDCDCAEKEEQRIGSPIKYGYPCLADNSELIKKATAYKNDKSLPENEQLKQEADKQAIKFAEQFKHQISSEGLENIVSDFVDAFLAGASFVSQPSIEKCNETIEEICKGMENSPELIKHKANWLYILQRLSFWKDMPVLLELIKYEQSLAVSQNRDEEIAELKEKLKYIELQKDLRHAAYLEMLAKAKKLEEIAIEFAEWINFNGWQEYDEPERWISPTQSKKVITTKQLYSLFIESKGVKK